MEYRFQALEWNSLKGLIGEHLAKSYIRNILAPKLKKEEQWNHVVLSNNDYRKHNSTLNRKLFLYDHFREDFMVHGFCASRTLLAKYSRVVEVLRQNHCTPDGLLLKLRETGKVTRSMEKNYFHGTNLRTGAFRRPGILSELPEVDGDLEVIEVKCGRRAKLLDKQKETYNRLIAKGVPLRKINVKIVSLDLNRFLVEERKFENLL